MASMVHMDDCPEGEPVRQRLGSSHSCPAMGLALAALRRTGPNFDGAHPRLNSPPECHRSVAGRSSPGSARCQSGHGASELVELPTTGTIGESNGTQCHEENSILFNAAPVNHAREQGPPLQNIY